MPQAIRNGDFSHGEPEAGFSLGIFGHWWHHRARKAHFGEHPDAWFRDV
jgi:hypothetical protein